MKIINKKIEELKPYENNPRNNEEAVDYVVKSIKEFGFKVPIVLDKNNEIIAGHTRYKASIKLGLKEVPCIIADNKVSESADWDFNMLNLELEDINIDMTEFGFNEEIFDDEYGTDFELPDGEKLGIDKMTLYFANKQTEIIEEAISKIDLEKVETFGNEHKKGNAIYEVVRQWLMSKK